MESGGSELAPYRSYAADATNIIVICMCLCSVGVIVIVAGVNVVGLVGNKLSRR